MNRTKTSVAIIMTCILLVLFAFRATEDNAYVSDYYSKIRSYTNTQNELLFTIKNTDLKTTAGIELVKQQIENARLKLKGIDFFLRYVDPVTYKKINGPLPVEWETEVFEKYEKPYKREDAGLTLAELYLDEKEIVKDSLMGFIQNSIAATPAFLADSTTKFLKTFDHFFLANRLFLLNLSAIYTTGFECPNTDRVIPELQSMLADVKKIYTGYDQSFPSNKINSDYSVLFDKTIQFVSNEPMGINEFDHFTFIRDYVNPLFALNQKMIRDYKVVSYSFNDYSLNNECNSVFDKSLYEGQNRKGVFIALDDTAELSEIKKIGKLLFYDPLLSGNNKRSCVSCHKPKEYFTDTAIATNLNFDRVKSLPRNSISLINVLYNHVLMTDGRHLTMVSQGKDVTTNSDEMGSNETEMLEKIMSCKEYKKAFDRFLKYTPAKKKITLDHIVSTMAFYYSGFSDYSSPFDDAITHHKPVSEEVVKGFNLFMSKAQCGTCHFVPQFNGVKPPYIETEFEVLGVPADSQFKQFSVDSGRYHVNPAKEMMNAFRTGTVRNAFYTKPYMHNGVFNTLEEVIDFYDAGGGTGRGLKINNQTLSSDSLKLTTTEKKALIEFIKSLNEQIPFENPPDQLPVSSIKELNKRKVGGEY